MFVDTPGIFAPKRRLETAMVKAASAGIADADLVLLLLDVRKGLDANARLVLTPAAAGAPPRVPGDQQAGSRCARRRPCR